MSTIDQLLAASRDASCWPRPNTRSAKVLHVAINVEGLGTAAGQPQEEFYGAAACDPSRMPLDMSVAGPAEDVPAAARCRRRGCASRWPAYQPRTSIDARPSSEIAGGA